MSVEGATGDQGIEPAREFVVRPVTGLPEIEPGADLAELIARAVPDLSAGDILVVSSKVVSKAENRVVQGVSRLDAVDAETVRLVARRGDTRIVQTRHGFVMAAAGVDNSNVAPGSLVLLPLDPDGSARGLRAELGRLTGVRPGVVVTDTFGRPWRYGQTDLAVGAAGVVVAEALRGRTDAYGNPLAVTAPAIADELAAAGDLAKGKLTATPVALVRGLAAAVTEEDGPGVRALVRIGPEDMFRLGTLEAQREAALAVRTGTALGPVPVDAPALRPVVEGLVRRAYAAVGEPGPGGIRVVDDAGDPESFKALLDRVGLRTDVAGLLIVYASSGLERGSERRLEPGTQPGLAIEPGAELRLEPGALLSLGAVVDRVLLGLRVEGFAAMGFGVPGEAGPALVEAASLPAGSAVLAAYALGGPEQHP